MKRLIALTGATMLALALPAAADQYSNSSYDGYNSSPSAARSVSCEKNRSDDKMAGGVAGAVIGGLIGGAIGNNIDNDDDRYRGHRGYRGYRGHRGYRGNYRRGHRGYRGHHYKRKSSNDEEVIVGALLGAVVGGIAGSSMAESSAKDCQEVYQPRHRSNSYPSGSAYPNTPPPRTVSTTRTYPAPSSPTTTYPRPTTTYPQPTTNTGPECRTVYQETQLPNGEVLRDPIQACRTGTNGEWQIDGDGLAGGSYRY